MARQYYGEWEQPQSDLTDGRLPWAGEHQFDLSRRGVQIEEKGSFGAPITRYKSNLRGKSTPLRAAKDDAIKLENLKTEDAVFGRLKEESRTRSIEKERSLRQSPLTPVSGSFPSGVTESEPRPGKSQPDEHRQATEVLLSGFSGAFQYAAVDFYEKISGGFVYEDYERHPPGSRPATFRPREHARLDADALRKKNSLRSGDCWVKVTFNSREAALTACRSSPHAIQGFLVSADLWNGTVPSPDQPVPATPGAIAALRKSRKLAPIGTAGVVVPEEDNMDGTEPEQEVPSPTPQPDAQTSQPSSPSRSGRVSPPSNTDDADGASTTAADNDPANSTLRVRGARRAKLRPAEQALLPVKPAWQSTLELLPLIGLFFQDDDIIGSQVPRTASGEFDWEYASFYWKFWALIDYWFGTDFCGLRSLE